MENGRLLTQEQIGFRVMEFLGGLSMLAPHIDTIRCVRRLVNILFVSMSLPFLHDY